MKHKILFIGSCGYAYDVNGGEIAKCRIIYQYFCNKFTTKLIDTYWERKNPAWTAWNKTFGNVIKLLRIIRGGSGQIKLLYVVAIPDI